MDGEPRVDAQNADYMLIFGPSERCPRCWGRGAYYGMATTYSFECGRCHGVGWLHLVEQIDGSECQ